MERLNDKYSSRSLLKLQSLQLSAFPFRWIFLVIFDLFIFGVKAVRFKYILMLILLFLLIALVCPQQILSDELPLGTFNNFISEDKEVPRHYLCGVQSIIETNFKPALIKCQAHSDCQNISGRAQKCITRIECWQQQPAKLWNITKEIIPIFCHFQDWSKTIRVIESKDPNRKVDFCPERHYVYGMRIKLDQMTNTISGLILACRNPMNSRQSGQRLIFDGIGQWRIAYASSNYAVGLSLKRKDGYLTGLKMKMARMPLIFAFELKYQFPKDFNVVPQTIDNVIVNNKGLLPMKKEIELSRQKEYRRSWNNDIGYLHGVQIGKIASETLLGNNLIGLPIIQTNVFPNTFTQANRQGLLKSFVFGNSDSYRIGQSQKDIVQIPPCTKYIIKQIVYVSYADVPYVLKIGYTNGISVEYESINGNYKGVSTSEVETDIDYIKIC